ncbi:MAG: histidine kinase [Propionicimonas sp.]|uniref:sensor histidine kinase n=1 Tax=Propionicimonas sp. TaxID=1955623 RepID=UPI003D1156C4
MMSRRRAAPDQVSWLARMVDSGTLEAALAGLLAVLVVLLDGLTAQPWQPVALDLTACVLAGLTPRWPRAAGVSLGAVLTLYVFIPASWGTLGEYSLLIPILGTGMRGSRRTRLFMTLAYFVILCAEAVTDDPAGRTPVIGWIAWAVLIAVLWLIGNVYFATIHALRAGKKAELVLQRQALARSLHDTVARSLTRVVMAAEAAQLRGHASGADLALISDAAARSTDELRWLMALLRDPDEDAELNVEDPTPLDRALTEAQTDLASHGFVVAMSAEGGFERLSRTQSELLGAIAAEACGNIVKHAEPGTACAIIVKVGEQDAEMVFVNRPRSEAREPSRFGSMGLSNVRGRVEQLGGELVVERQPDQWSARVRVPLAQDGSPPEKVA